MILFPSFLIFIYLLNFIEAKQYNIRKLKENFSDDNNYPVSSLRGGHLSQMKQDDIYHIFIPITIFIPSLKKHPCLNSESYGKKKFFVMHYGDPLNSKLYNQFSGVLSNFKPNQSTRRTLKAKLTRKQIKRRLANQSLMEIFEGAGLSMPILPSLPFLRPISPTALQSNEKLNNFNNSNDKDNDFEQSFSKNLINESDEDKSESTNDKNYNYNFNIVNARRNKNKNVRR